MTPERRTIPSMRNIYFPKSSLQNFFARPILTAVFVTRAIKIAVVAASEVREFPLESSDISCVIASTSARPEKSDTK